MVGNGRSQLQGKLEGRRIAESCYYNQMVLRDGCSFITLLQQLH